MTGGLGDRRRRRHLVAAGLVGLATAAALLTSPGRPAAASDPLLSTLCFGAGALEPDSHCEQATDGPTFPSAEQAPDDRSPSYQRDCQVRPPFADRWTCEYGDLSASRNVALVGNSHAVHWLPALHEVGLRRGFKVTTYVSAMCFATTTRIAWRTKELRDNCENWGHWLRGSIAEGDYDLVVQTERTYKWPEQKFTGHADDVFAQAYRDHLARWKDAGKTVLVIRDSPMPKTSVPTCLLRNPTDFAVCANTTDDALQRDPLVEAAESFMSPRVRVADLTSYFCDAGVCPAVVGRVPVFFDSSHVTATYARTLAPYLDEHVMRALKVDADARSAASRAE